ncbi:LysR family transcriptional regulator substrate-binding protein [Adlercreutzia muris]|uniref:LysR family transcriptional regulator substrate-binding protein n=2 Tax=Adlercreutzia muris TaxID=1796610 RepID=UPI003B967850
MRAQLDFMLEVEHIARPGYEGLVFPGADVWGVYPLPDTPLAGKTSVRPEDLVGEPLIVSRQFLKSGFLKQWAGECYASIKPAVSTDIFPSHWRRLVEGRVGHMLGYLYFQNEEDSVLGSHGIPFDPPLETGNALIWKKGRPLSRASQVFLEELRRIVGGE